MRVGGMRIVVLLLGALFLLSADAVEPSVSWETGRKKVVSFGWEWRYLTPADFARCADRIEATGLDGVGMYIYPKGHEGEYEWSSRWLCEAKFTWTHEMVDDQISTLREVTGHKGLRESFIMSLAAPRKRIGWRDDERWHRVAQSMGTMAWMAKKSGIRGLAIDPEDYSRANQYKRCAGDEPWEVLAPLARQRGREVFSEVFREYPEIAVCAFWLLSWEIGFVDANNSMAAAASGGNLWPAFVNGILDVMPPTAVLIDGNEWSYQYEASRREFAASAIAQRNASMGLVAPENRLKYRGQVFPGFGIYLDSYTGGATNSDGKANKYYFGPENGSRLGHLERNLSSALRNCGEYVWFWGEQYTWIDHADGQKLLPDVRRAKWEDKLPGLSSIVRVCSNPKAFLSHDLPLLRENGLMKNLMAEKDVGEMSASAQAKPDGSRHFACRLPAETVKPGTHFVLAVEGVGDGLSVGYWWTGGRLPNGSLALAGSPDGRRRGVTVISVPEGALGLNIDFYMGDKCSFERAYLGLVPTKIDNK